ncbi:MAG: cytochrome c oxidase subunit 3 [Parasphingopyxis sp.]|uniref:cytochrome c oxidase subunit 3 n=1 Tax=Parasphingopyxis sp. TaxID=1920299 RepID=UPI00262D30D0|nr:cytochrome c oxidase subunit 3 [uncultured Parasphingopyxis sp.]
MAGAAPQHDYHLVNPSIWPLIGAFSALVMAMGGILWMHAPAPDADPAGAIDALGALGFMSPLMMHAGWVFFAGLIGVLFTMFSWWVDVIDEAHEGHHKPVVQLHMRYGMILFIASEVMFFVGWFWAFFGAALFPASIDGAEAVFPPPGIEVLDPFSLPLLNTMILLCSGTTVTWAHHCLLKGDRKGLINGLWLTILLGVLFSFIQAYEYVHAPFDFKNNIYGATFFMATGFHGFHVIVGTIFLAVCLIRAYRGDFTPKQHFGFEAAAWYWHFVDVVWLFLFASIYIWGSAGAPIH